MTRPTDADQQACEVPLVEQLRSIPKDYRTCRAIQWSDDGRETGHQFIPVGFMMHRAADEIDRLRAAPPTTKPSGEAVVLVPTEVPGQVIQWLRDNYGIRSGHKAMWAMLLDVATNPTSPYTMRLEPSPSPTKEPK